MRWCASSLVLLAACAGGAGRENDGPTPTPTPTLPTTPTPTPTPTAPTTPPEPPTVSVADGEDWSLPPDTEPAPNSGFFSESALPAAGVDVHVIDVTWAMLEPKDGQWSTTTPGMAEGMPLPPFDTQLALGGRYWLRIWVSSTDWAPAWVLQKCKVEPITGKDYDGQEHLPIWNACVWDEAMQMYEEFLVNRGLLADPDLVLAYAPGAFTWCEFDFDMINLAVAKDGLDFGTFDAWFGTMVSDLVQLDPAHSDKLVFTGEDYPYGPWGSKDDLFAFDAVNGGMGIRSGITEVTNDHLSEVPAYGVHIAPDGHLVTDETWPLLTDPDRVIAAENECFTACGFHADDVAYAVREANLKALQLRVNWLYVVPGPSYMEDFPELWDWTALELGRRAADAPDAWAQLRDAEDRYWTDEGTGPGGVAWDGYPYVKNYERWLVQRDVAPDGVSRRGTEQHVKELDPANGTAWEGRRTDHANGSDYLYFDVDAAFLDGAAGAVEVKITFRDTGSATWWLEYPTRAGVAVAPSVVNTGTGGVRTATWTLHDARFDGSLAGGTDFRLNAGGADDLEVTFARVVKLPPD